MKKKVFLTMAAIQAAIIQTRAAGNIFGDPTSFVDEIKSYAPAIILVVFIVSGLFNLGNFFGEKRDYKAGIYNIIGFVGGTTIFLAVAQYVAGLSIS